MHCGRSRAIAFLIVTALSCPRVFAASPGEERLATGIAFVKSGDFTSAIDPLAAAIQRLEAESGRKPQLARAYLYLGIAYLELGQELEAQGKFREALRVEPSLKLSPEEFSAQQIRVFEASRLQKKKKLPLPLIFILGGGAASAGVAVAASGGSSGSPTTTAVAATTTTTMGGSGGGTTTTTLSSGPTTTQPGSTTTTTTTTTLPGATTTTTLPGATTTTTTTTTLPTTTTTSTTTMPPSCSYGASPDKPFGVLGGTGVCNINASAQGCSWNAEVFPSSATSWLHLTGAQSGTGNGQVPYSVAALGLVSRSAVIRVQQNHGAVCNITQTLFQSSTGLAVDSRLEAPGAKGQIVVNGDGVAFQGEALLSHVAPVREGMNRIEAIVVSADGKPGTWRFDLQSGFEPGTLVSLSGAASFPTAGSIVFQITGETGQRLVFQFQGRVER